MNKGSVERRAHARFSKEFELEGALGPGVASARMVGSELSLGGLYCSSSSDFPEMTRLAVRLMLPVRASADDAQEVLDLEAVVVRRKRMNSTSGAPRYELALFFTSMEDTQRERLARYLAHS